MPPWSAAVPNTTISSGATPSSSTGILHPEDSQPNESIEKRRRQNRPPLVRSTAPTVPPRRKNFSYRGRGRGRGVGVGVGGRREQEGGASTLAGSSSGVHNTGNINGPRYHPSSMPVKPRLPHRDRQPHPLTQAHPEPSSSRAVNIHPPHTPIPTPSGAVRGGGADAEPGSPHFDLYKRFTSPKLLPSLTPSTYHLPAAPPAKRRRLNWGGRSTLPRAPSTSELSASTSTSVSRPEKVVVNVEETPRQWGKLDVGVDRSPPPNTPHTLRQTAHIPAAPSEQSTVKRGTKRRKLVADPDRSTLQTAQPMPERPVSTSTPEPGAPPEGVAVGVKQEEVSPTRHNLEVGVDRSPPPAVEHSSPRHAVPISSATPVDPLERAAVKHEEPPPPSLALAPSRRLLSSGAKRYAPLPRECEKMHRNYKMHREAWSATEKKALKQLGLKITKWFVREDGMVIEWESPQPVWSDTLLPEVKDLASAIARVHAANDQNRVLNLQRKRKSALASQPPSNLSPEVSSFPHEKPSTSALDPPLATQPITSDSPGDAVEVLSSNEVCGEVDQVVGEGLRTSTISPPRMQFTPRKTPTESRFAEADRAPTLLPVEKAPRAPSTPTEQERTVQEATQLSAGQEMELDQVVGVPTPPAEQDNPIRHVPIVPTSPVEQQHALQQVEKSLTRAELAKVEEAALQFLERYIQTFDHDRSELEGAYSPNAMFSYRIDDCASLLRATLTSPSKAELFAPRANSRVTSGPHSHLGIKQGRRDVVAALRSLGPHKFCLAGLSVIDYDLVYLREASDLLLACFAEVTDSRDGSRLRCDQSFVLRTKECNEDHSTVELWPLVAVSHQMAIREIPSTAHQPS